MVQNPHPEPTSGTRILEIVVGTLVIAGIVVFLIGFNLAAFVEAYQTGSVSLPRSGNRPAAYAQEPLKFTAIIAIRVMIVLGGMAVAAYAFMRFFLRKPPVRW